jgi:hypothetical protein
VSNCFQADKWRPRGFKSGVDFVEICPFSTPRFGIESLRDRALALLERWDNDNFQEFVRLKARLKEFPPGAIGADERDDHCEPRIRGQLGDLRYAANVLYPIRLRKAEISAQPMPNVAAIQRVSMAPHCQ